MRCLVVILGLLVAAVQAAPGERFLAGPTPLNVHIPLIEGAPNVQAPKIVNGYPAVEGQFPYHAAIIIDGATLCGGSLISPDFVLTAAHRVVGSSFQVILGCIQWQGTDCVRITTSNVIVHPGYDSSTLENDVALLRLPTPVTYTSTIQPVALPPADSNTYEGVTALVCGFGATSDNGAVSPTLNWVDLLIINNTQCSQYYGSIIQSGIICASGAGGKSPCIGDDGGALVVLNSGGYTLIGVLSYVSSVGCGSGYPFSYTRVTSFLGWICSNTGLCTRS